MKSTPLFLFFQGDLLFCLHSAIYLLLCCIDYYKAVINVVFSSLVTEQSRQLSNDVNGLVPEQLVLRSDNEVPQSTSTPKAVTTFHQGEGSVRYIYQSVMYCLYLSV